MTDHDHHDDLAAVRGIRTALILALPLWAAIIAIVRHLW